MLSTGTIIVILLLLGSLAWAWSEPDRLRRGQGGAFRRGLLLAVTVCDHPAPDPPDPDAAAELEGGDAHWAGPHELHFATHRSGLDPFVAAGNIRWPGRQGFVEHRLSMGIFSVCVISIMACGHVTGKLVSKFAPAPPTAFLAVGVTAAGLIWLLAAGRRRALRRSEALVREIEKALSAGG